MIDFNSYWSLVYHFFMTHKVIAAGLCFVVIFISYKKPVGALKFAGFCAFLVTALYIMSMLSESGSLGEIHKKDMTDKTESGLTN